MRHYETLYIVHPALEAGRLKDTIQNVDTHLKGFKNEILTTEVWGKKRLAYYIDKQKYGTYVLVQYKSDGANNKEFHVELEHNPSILAYMTTKIDEDDIREQTEDLDAQLSEDKKAPVKDEKSSKEVKTEEVVKESNPEPVTENSGDDTAVVTEEKGEE